MNSFEKFRMAYLEEEMLMLSGIQHYVFCPRQWALIELEQLWADNYRTTQGSLLHSNADNPDYRVKNNDSILLRHMSLISKRLGIYGIADVVEMKHTKDPVRGIPFKKEPGLFQPMPVEYKRGRPKQDLCDVAQLVCQAMCLEEMHGIRVDKAALFYWETRHRVDVEVTAQLRQFVTDTVYTMHSIVQSCEIPKQEPKKGCRSCSLINVCLPEIGPTKKAFDYLSRYLYA